MYQYLNFFNKKGEYCNFQYDSTNDKWIGRIDFGSISTGIIEDFQIYILEEIYNPSTDGFEFVYPLKNSFLGQNGYLEFPIIPIPESELKINAYFDNKAPVEDLFIYDFNISSNINLLNKVYNMEYLLKTDAYQDLADANFKKPYIKRTENGQSTALQINLGFQPSEENGYQSILYIKDYNGHVFAEILLYGEGEEEDERLRDLLVNMGQDLLPSDIKIFDKSDVNESEVDWKLMNYKRKELLLEYSNIFPYIGTYKALINIIKFFGFQNLRMKEYWLNVDSSSVYYGKYKQIDITDVFDEDANYISSGLVPSKIYKKTSKFGLFYDITVPSGEYDEDGVPIAEEVFSFSPEEVLIKIYALKKKLQNYFLPVNARIVDIIGEAIYFAKYEANFWNDQCRIDDVKLGLKPKFSVLPSREGYIEDLRPLYYFGCPVGPDLTIGGQTNLLSWRIVLGANGVDVSDLYLDNVQTFTQELTFSNGDIYFFETIIKKDPDTGQIFYKNWEVANKIIETWRNHSFIQENFNVYQEGGTSGAIRIVQKNPIGDMTVYCTWYSNSNPGPPSINEYQIPNAYGFTPTINVSTGASGTFGASGAPISYFSGCLMGYFDKSNVSVFNLNDDEDIPVGYPIVLRNDTFNINWDDADTNFNQIDRNSPVSNGPLYANYNFSSDPGFPLTNPLFPSQDNYSWINLGYYGYYQMRWVVSKAEDDMPAFYYDSGEKFIDEINTLPLILPYVGKYKVELYLWDGYNTMSFLINEDWINVSMYDSNFIGWYKKRELEYNLDTKRYKIQSDISLPNGPIKNKPNLNLSWSEYNSTWDLPLHPNESIGMSDISFHSLDSIEFYQSIINPIENPLVDRYPYRYDLITELPTWNDFYHLWWDGIGTKLTQIELNTIPGSNVTGTNTIVIYMTRENSIFDISPTNNIFQVITTYTGPTANYPIQPKGSLLISNNRRTYMSDGTLWKYVNNEIDYFRFDINYSSGEPLYYKLLRVVEQLNVNLYEDGIEHPYLKDFIYYLDFKYGNSYEIIPYIRAVSKNPDSGNRHKIRVDSYTTPGTIEYTKSYETVNFGYLGDIPTSFEIYQAGISSNRGIKLPGMTDFYPTTATTLIGLTNELNGPTAQANTSIGKFTYNLVYGYSGWNGVGNVPNVNQSPYKIIAISKAFTSPEEIKIEYSGGIIGTTYGRSLIKNPNFDQIRILKYTEELPLCTVVNFTYDNSRVRGKKNPIWKLIKEGDPDFDDIYYNNKYFSYMFTERGSYSISLEIEDTNGNKQTIEKKEIIKII